MNESQSQQQYLEAQILTATPQKLRLLLIEGAMRFSRLAMAAFEQQKLEEFQEKITRARDIVCELLTSIQMVDSEIANNTRAIYAFLLRELAEIQLTKTIERIPGVLKVLAAEHETWSQICLMEPARLHEDNALQQHSHITFLAPDVECENMGTGISIDA